MFLGSEHLGRFMRSCFFFFFFLEDKSQTLSKEREEQKPIMKVLPQK